MNKEERATLRRAVERARHLLDHEVADQLEGIFGILPNGKVLDDAPGDPTVRYRLLAVIAHHRAGGETVKGAVERARRELAFTTLNRFVALKMAERRGIVGECVSKGPLSDGIRELADCAPGLRATFPDGGYRLLLEATMDEVSLGLSILFDRRAPTGLIWPRPKVLDDLLQVLNAAELASAWEQDETIGWVYQYFNPKEERDEMRAASRSRGTRESWPFVISSLLHATLWGSSLTIHWAASGTRCARAILHLRTAAATSCGDRPRCSLPPVSLRHPAKSMRAT